MNNLAETDCVESTSFRDVWHVDQWCLMLPFSNCKKQIIIITLQVTFSNGQAKWAVSKFNQEVWCIFGHFLMQAHVKFTVMVMGSFSNSAALNLMQADLSNLLCPHFANQIFSLGLHLLVSSLSEPMPCINHLNYWWVIHHNIC